MNDWNDDTLGRWASDGTTRWRYDFDLVKDRPVIAMERLTGPGVCQLAQQGDETPLELRSRAFRTLNAHESKGAK